MRTSAYRGVSVPLRAAASMPLGALVVHQLRYYAVFGSHAGERLAREGHGYLQVAEPLVLLATATALGFAVGRLTRVWRGEGVAVGAPSPLRRTALLCALALLTLYGAQELAEGALGTGHAAGLAGVFGHGGVLAIPFALVVGSAIALVLHAGHALLELAARRAQRSRVGIVDVPTPACKPDAVDWRLRPASGIAAGRAPPLLAV